MDLPLAYRNTELVFGEIGIDVAIEERVANKVDAELFEVSDVETACTPTESGAKNQGMLYDLLGLDHFGDTKLVSVLFVKRIYNPLTKKRLKGCGAFPRGKPVLVVNAETGTPWTIAHKLAHVLVRGTSASGHVENDSNNLLAPNTSKFTGIPHLNERQAKAAKTSKFLTRL